MPPKKFQSPELEEIVNDPDNRFCCDCGAKAPRWASVNLGLLMCIDCSGTHRHIGVHVTVIKSVTLDKWQPKWIERVKAVGNRVANNYWENRVPSHAKPTPQDSLDTKGTFIRAKYERREYVPQDRGAKAPHELIEAGQNPDAYASGGDIHQGRQRISAVNPAIVKAQEYQKGNTPKASNAPNLLDELGGATPKKASPSGVLNIFGDSSSTAASVLPPAASNAAPANRVSWGAFESGAATTNNVDFFAEFESAPAVSSTSNPASSTTNNAASKIDAFNNSLFNNAAATQNNRTSINNFNAFPPATSTTNNNAFDPFANMGNAAANNNAFGQQSNNNTNGTFGQFNNNAFGFNNNPAQQQNNNFQPNNNGFSNNDPFAGMYAGGTPANNNMMNNGAMNNINMNAPGQMRFSRGDPFSTNTTGNMMMAPTQMRSSVNPGGNQMPSPSFNNTPVVLKSDKAEAQMSFGDLDPFK